MNHDRARDLLPAYADRQLGWFQRVRLGRHLVHCPSCLTELEAMQAMRTAVRTNLPVYRAPPALAMRIGSALPREAPPPDKRRAGRFSFGGTAMAGGLMAGGLAGIALTLAVSRITPVTDPLVADVVGDHVRSMMADHLMDVATSDRHTVKPWLSARLDLSPVVRDFAAEGYPLAGGRLDYVDGHRAAAIVYRRDKHVINLFVFAGGDRADGSLRQESRDGFNIVRWQMGGLCYVAVSDVEAAQLLTFGRLVRDSET